MQDVDFEELDKAVNAVMPQAPLDNSNTDPSVDLEIQPMQPPDPTPVSIAPVSSSPVVGRPATGRFMDVVHPSSDMRSSLTMPQRSTNSMLNLTAQPAPAAAPVPIPTPVPYTSPVSVETPKPAVENWAGLPNYQTPSEAPESPFLPEAKVEKRPLGAFSNEMPTTASPTPTSAETNSQPMVSTETPPTPPELDNSLLDVESDSSTHSNDAELATNPLSQPYASTSINQQYTEKPTTSQNNGSIYDANSYQKVTARKPKKKSGWMWVLWIVILIIVGAGAGVAFYFLVMPNLSGFKLPF